MSLRPRTIDEARARFKPMRRTAMRRNSAPMRRTPMKKAKRDPQHEEWRRKVLDQDGYQCRWIDESGRRCGARGTPENASHLDAHHINERSQRPDLRYEPSNGAILCGGPGRHHDRAHHTSEGRARAIELGLLGGETYEKARFATVNVPASEGDQKI